MPARAMATAVRSFEYCACIAPSANSRPDPTAQYCEYSKTSAHRIHAEDPVLVGDERSDLRRFVRIVLFLLRIEEMLLLEGSDAACERSRKSRPCSKSRDRQLREQALEHELVRGASAQTDIVSLVMDDFSELRSNCADRRVSPNVVSESAAMAISSCLRTATSGHGLREDGRRVRPRVVQANGTVNP
jgi:hypothetical protein